MVCAILSRQDELLQMPLATTSMLFACLSRFIALMDQGQDEPTNATLQFDHYKECYARSLTESKEIKIDDVFVLATALAAEQVKSKAMWDTFARIAVEKEYEVEERQYFKSFANLAWAMSKVQFDGSQFWPFIERLFSTELKRTKLAEQPRDLSGSILATICFSIKEVQPHDFSDEFWSELNHTLRDYLQQSRRR